jgi:hypothetical protein
MYCLIICMILAVVAAGPQFNDMFLNSGGAQNSRPNQGTREAANNGERINNVECKCPTSNGTIMSFGGSSESFNCECNKTVVAVPKGCMPVGELIIYICCLYINIPM